MNAMAGAHYWDTSVPDWEARIMAGKSLFPDLPLDAARADRALRIFCRFRVPDIEGTPTYGEVCDQWVFDLVRAVFGAFDATTRARMIREYFLMVPKKNSKTAIAAAVLVVALILNERPGAEALLIAPTQKIAEMAFAQAAGIIRLSETPHGTPLTALFSVHSHMRTIKFLNPEMPSEMTVKAADADVITGSKASYVLIDETHVFASRPKADGVFTEIRGGLSHPQNTGFLLQITTQSKTPPQGVFKSEIAKARAVRDGVMASSMLAVIYEFPPSVVAGGQWRDETLWPRVNPHMGRSVSLDFLRDEYTKALSVGVEAVALFASQHLNVEIGQSLSGTSWDGARHWPGCGDKAMTLPRILDASEVLVIGIDWGGADDLASLALFGRRATDRRWLHWSRSWARPSVFEARKTIAGALRDFERDGDLEVVESPDEQAARCADICAQIMESGLLPERGGIGIDAAGVALLLDALAEREIVDPMVVAIPQGWKLSQAVATLPLKLEAGQVIHCAQPIMGWAVGNAKQELRGANYVISKSQAGSAKIDPLAATLNAAMLMLQNPEAVGRSYLDAGRLMVL